MSRRSGCRGSAARNAPFGTDIQPATKVKIIGGKQVEVPVDSPPTSAGNQSSQKNLPPLTSHGTPPIEVQLSHQGYEDKEEEEERETLFTQKENARNLYPKTAPADKSNSHIHDNRGIHKNLPGSHKVLPPISIHSGNSRSPSPLFTNNNTIDNFSSSSDISSHDISQLNQPEVSLTDQLKEALEGYDAGLFKDMYKDMAQYDSKLSGYVSEAQANMVALRYHLPLNTNMLKLLFSNFAKNDNPDMVNYEKMIQYLARAQRGSADAQTVLQESINRFVNAPQSAQSTTSNGSSSLQEQINRFDRQREEVNQQIQQWDMQQTYRQHQRQQQQQHSKQVEPGRMQSWHQGSPSNWSGRRQSMESEDKLKQEMTDDIVPVRKPLRVFSDREDAKLLMLVEQQYLQGGEEPTDLLDMRNKFQAKDSLKQGTLAKREIQDVCFSLRVPIQGSLMEKLMQRCYTGEEQYSWPTFLDFLERVKPLNTGSNKHTPEPPRAKTWPTNYREENQTGGSKAPALPQAPGPPPWETRKPLARLGRKSLTDVEKEITCYDQPDEDLPSHASSATNAESKDVIERRQLEALAREHRAKAIQASIENQARTLQEQEAGERWFERFFHLAQGLYNADSTNTGYLSKEEMYRIIRNYNLIYQLGFSDSRIDRVINSHATPDGMVSVEHLLESLRQRIN